jgi:hypothetical protein
MWLIGGAGKLSSLERMPMAEGEIVYVAVVPPASSDGSLIKEVAEVIGKDAYQARLLMVGVLPRIVARCTGMQTAESMAQGLKALKLVAIVSKEDELRRPHQGLKAETLKFGEGEVVFHQADGKETVLKAGDVFLMIKGMRPYSPEGEAIEKELKPNTKLKINIGATLMTGGIPIFKKTKVKSKAADAQSEWFVRLYGRSSPESGAEILQHSLNYAFLDAEMATSSLANFMNVLNRMKKAFPQAFLDERLGRSFSVDIPATTDEDNIEINCRLIYFQHLAGSSSKPLA